MPYVGQGFFKISVAAQASTHRAPNEAKKPTFPQWVGWRNLHTGAVHAS